MKEGGGRGRNGETVKKRDGAVFAKGYDGPRRGSMQWMNVQC
jgi:hypothetical protein